MKKVKSEIWLSFVHFNQYFANILSFKAMFYCLLQVFHSIKDFLIDFEFSLLFLFQKIAKSLCKFRNKIREIESSNCNSLAN